MQRSAAVGWWWALCLVSLLAWQAAAGSNRIYGRGKGYHHSIPCCMDGCGGTCGGGGGGGSGGTSAYAYISSQAELSTAKSVIDEIGWTSRLQGSFADTFFVPTNAALDAYAAKITANVTWNTDIGHGFLKLFFTKLFQYHIITGSYSSSQLQPGAFGTEYVSSNGMPHKVTKSSSNSLVDEQGNSVSISGSSQAVVGGGYVHVLAGVLQPNDIFPSLAIALASSEFSQLRAIIEKIDKTLQPEQDIASMLEDISGTLALPNNEALSGLDINSIDAYTLLDVLTYHVCPFKRYYRLLYTPFTVGKKPGKNPCLPVLSRAYDFPYGLKYSYDSASNMTITFATGTFPNALVPETTKIVMADLSIPTHSAHVISSVIMPPANISNAASSTASRVQHNARILSLLSSLSTSSKGKQQGSGSSSGNGGGWSDDDDDASDDTPEANETPVKSGGGSGGNSANGGAQGRLSLDSLIARARGSGSAKSLNAGSNTKSRSQQDGSNAAGEDRGGALSIDSVNSSRSAGVGGDNSVGLQVQNPLDLVVQRQQQQLQQQSQQQPVSRPTARRHRNSKNPVMNPKDLSVQPGGKSSRSKNHRAGNTAASRTADGGSSAEAPSAAAGGSNQAGSGGGGIGGSLASLSILRP